MNDDAMQIWVEQSMQSLSGWLDLGLYINRQKTGSTHNPIAAFGVSDEKASQIVRAMEIYYYFKHNDNYGLTGDELVKLSLPVMKTLSTLTTTAEHFMRQQAVLARMWARGEISTSRLKNLVSQLRRLRQVVCRVEYEIAASKWAGRPFRRRPRQVLDRELSQYPPGDRLVLRRVYMAALHDRTDNYYR